MCYKGHNHSVWVTTGVAVSLQDRVAALEVNDVFPGGGLRAAAVQSARNHLSVRVAAANSSAALAVSFIRAHHDCGDAGHNPAYGGNGSNGSVTDGRATGHVALTAADEHAGSGDAAAAVLPFRAASGDTRTAQSRRGGDGSMLLSLGGNASLLAHLPPGDYQLCARVGGGAFEATGISLVVHRRVEGVSANYLDSGHGLQVVMPARPGNRVRLRLPPVTLGAPTANPANRSAGNVSSNGSNRSNLPANTSAPAGANTSAAAPAASMWIALRPPAADCSDLPPARRAAGAAGGGGGLFEVGRDELVSMEDAARLARMVPGLYQLCVYAAPSTLILPPPHHAVPSHAATGISVRLQSSAAAMTVNAVQAAGGLRAALPLVAGNQLSLTLAGTVDARNASLGGLPHTHAAPAAPAPAPAAPAPAVPVWVWMVSPRLHCNASIGALDLTRQAALPALFRPRPQSPGAVRAGGAGAEVSEEWGAAAVDDAVERPERSQCHSVIIILTLLVVSYYSCIVVSSQYMES